VKILFDQGAPRPLRKFLHPHAVDIALALGWSKFKNGDLIAAAESAGYDLTITTDQSIRYQQNLSERKIAIIVLLHTNWPKVIEPAVHLVLDAVAKVTPRAFIEVEFLGTRKRRSRRRK
jgi:hypothetical protein